MKKMVILLGLAFMLLLSNCSTHSALMRYSDIESISAKESSWDGEVLGTIYSDMGGAIWVECTELAQRNIRNLVFQAQNMGANAIGDFEWLPGDKASQSTPACKKRWGWFALWPFVLTPLFESADVSAKAYKVPGLDKDSKSVYYIPDTKEGREELIQRLLTIGN